MPLPYDVIAAQFSAERTPYREMAYVLRFAALLRPGAALLDIGCGTGQPIMQFILDQGFTVTGVDSSAAMLAYARQTCPEAEVIHADMMHFTPARRYGGLVAWDSVFHVPRRQHAHLFQSFSHWLEPGAPLLLSLGGSEWEGTAPMFGHDFFYSGYTPSVSESLLCKAGFAIVLSEVDDASSRGHIAVLCTNSIETPR